MPEMRRPLEPIEITTVDQYVWGFHHRTLLLQCADACPRSLHERRERCGYKNVSKFVKREGDWLGGLRPIPLVYLETIGCDLDVLKQAVTFDGQEYDQALRLLPPPTHFVIRLGSGMYSRRNLPRECSLAQAQALIRQFQLEQPRLGCCLHWSGLLSLFFEKGELVRKDRYRPEFILARDAVSFGPTGVHVGTTSL
jgi:hypothetical protein